MKPEFDIGIVGGGLVGHLAAIMLASRFKVALIEAQTPQLALSSLPALRVSALNQSACEMLKAQGIFAHLDSHRLGEVLAMAIDEPEGSVLHFNASDIGQLYLAYIVENEHLIYAMNQVSLQGGLTAIHDHCEGIKQGSSGSILQLRSGQELAVKLLIIAGGGQSSLHRSLSVPLSIADYRQNAWVAQVECEMPHHHTAYQRFLPTGPLAFLPLFHPHQVSIVWTLPCEESLSPDDLCLRLEQAFPHLGAIKLLQGPGHFPLFSQHVQKYVGQGFVLVGDAAHTVHPLAGQGANLGFQDVQKLVQVLCEAQSRGEDFASPRVLLGYQDKVKQHNRLFQLGFSSLNQLFQSQFLPLQVARRWGFRQVDRHSILKRAFMRLAQ